MKFIKIAFFTLLFAVVTDMVLVSAYPSPVGTGYSFDLDKNKAQWTSYRTKDTWSVQTYENLSALTILTNPCPNCQIAAKLFTESGDSGVAVITKPGQTKQFIDPTAFSSPGNYRVNVWRFDATLLTTHHTAMWMMNI